jgi:transcriptional regulator with XRE-family HTH domain
MTGAILRDLRLSLGISRAQLAAEVGVRPEAAADVEESKLMRPATVSKYMAALTRLARQQAESRNRAQVEELLNVLS